MNKLNKLTDTFVLSNGVHVPCVGYGTYLTPDGDVAKNSVTEAINVGYRHIDTAFAYGNEKAVGEGIKASGVKREDVFVTTKHWVTMRGYEKATEAIDISLKNLGLDKYINDIVLSIEDIDGNNKYDIKDFLSMNNSDIMKKNGGKKFDVVLMNPPYDNGLGNTFLEKTLAIADKVISDMQCI